MKFVTIQRNENITRLPFDKVCTVSEFLHSCSIPFSQPCGGNGICGKCRINISGEISEPTAEELKKLTQEELQSNIRLACQTKILGSCCIIIGKSDDNLEVRQDGIMPIFESDFNFKNYAVAVDIGTTTLALRMYSKDGLIESCGAENPQEPYGADVISRIGKSINGNSRELAVKVRQKINELIFKMLKIHNLDENYIDLIVLTGNTAMLYLLSQKNPDCLAHAPFIADELFGKFIPCEELELLNNKHSLAYLPRCMSAFVGADITTAVLASQICSSSSTALLADIGTNGEICLWHNNKLYCCSTAAGPAFEGNGLSCGMRGAPGAIDHVMIENGQLKIHTVGNIAPVGICGSGIIDLIAVLVENDVIDETGLIQDEDHNYTDRIAEDDDGVKFIITDKIHLTQKDVRMVQLAKSSICAGMETLIKTAELTPNNIDVLEIAGGFGSFVNISSAAKMGLIPAELEKKTVVLGNAALSGASMLLLNKKFKKDSDNIAENSKTVDLTSSPVFTDLYMENMMF